jgi:hypothetical protein
MRTIRDSDSSRPTAKSRSTAPISASWATLCVSWTKPSACGPMTMPVKRNPTSVGIFSRCCQQDRRNGDSDRDDQIPEDRNLFHA